MIREKVDPNSGAILFKKDPESKEVDEKIEELTRMIDRLEKRVKELEGENKGNS